MTYRRLPPAAAGRPTLIATGVTSKQPLRLLTLWSCAPRGIRIPNRQIRRLVLSVHAVRLSAVYAGQVRCRIHPDRQSPIWYWLVD